MAELVEVYRNSVQTWECDQMGHMNVQFYLDKSASGLTVLGHYLGLGPDYTREEKARLRFTTHHVRFLREQRAGEPLCMKGGVLDAGTDSLRVYLELTNPGTEEVAATFAADVELQDIASGDRRPLPQTVLDRARDLRAELPEYAAPRGLEMAPPRPAPTLAEAEAMGLLLTYTGVVQPQMCDEDGLMAIRWYMGVISDAIPNLITATRGPRRGSGGGGKVGGAALEYRFVYHKRPRSGDLLTLRSGIKNVGSKAYTLCHWLFDLTSGEAVATAEAVAIMFDLEARKAIVIPDRARAGLERYCFPELSV